jgi:hypothetical protein
LKIPFKPTTIKYHPSIHGSAPIILLGEVDNVGVDLNCHDNFIIIFKKVNDELLHFFLAGGARLWCNNMACRVSTRGESAASEL